MKALQENQNRMDWHLFWTAAGVVVPLAALIIGCYSKLGNDIGDVSKSVSELKTEVVKIQTVMIIKGLAPAELFASESEK